MNAEKEPSAGGGAALSGKVALVAGATRGGGRAMAVELGRAGATVYVTGRTARGAVSETGRPAETVEQTADLVTAAGGEGIAVMVDHLQDAQVRELVARIERDHGRLDILVNVIWGGDHLVEYGKKVRMWEHDLDKGRRMLRLGVESHFVTSHYALPLMIRRPGGLVVEITDGTEELNHAHYREPFFFDLAKYAPFRMVKALAQEGEEYGCTALALAPGFMRTEAVLEKFGVTEENWRDACATSPDFAMSETPAFVARVLAALATDPDVARFNGRSVSAGGLAREYGITDVDGSAPDPARYFAEVMRTGQHPDPADYR
ncbi:SDR family oxidoreductase [Streptomyces spectabilis]|uniref:NAD(P)-dependent dehydrogenase (Short-subunit alcohol dehydrogenase family) n=1 Tax=Streptomyces spectabilis TaxID=68270 RepID=A0A5P2WZY8_STRST|nr:SDR family oxidoreductase [Streptomyces spectabilis]MBB5107358.1 NAD(P)-dependent dehydrogenase (short-subunit alcohol dehydrogenase family) [Streptomyces spectabilis]MCI3900048.1 SDR family oxidoreductase [Streptomyces spectabilis]QEV57678.1 SDR family NAD(P)-dependent oxidoreductase [Streptomyces spectabilis]GGV37082.1 short-chain dehydrogenase [Streptomyces spectabilis]